jgi:hypothetical protein
MVRKVKAEGSSELTFRPDRTVPGEYHFAVGTAGSTGLVLQTVLMPLALSSAPSRLVLERTFLPIIKRMGPKAGRRRQSRVLRTSRRNRGADDQERKARSC